MDLAAATLLAALAAAPADEPTTVHEFPEQGLTIDLSALPALERRDYASSRVLGSWKGEQGETRLEMTLKLLPAEQYAASEPRQVLALAEWDRASRARDQDQPFAFQETWLEDGAYGYAAFASCGRGALSHRGEDFGELWCLAGVLPDAGYAIEIQVRPAASQELAGSLRTFFAQGVRYAGEERDREWTEEEVLERWRRDAPAELAEELEDVIRTDHYLVMGNAGGKLFAKKMEECYREIKKVFPFEDAEGQRLMPVFIFRTADQYYAFCTKRGWDLEDARNTKGHASGDYYATWYESPNDPVHIHEATHQIFANRLYLNGGGSWFQEGVAEYVESSDNDRNVVAGQVEDREHVALREFVQIQSLALSDGGGQNVRGTGGAGSRYKQAALFIEFLAESKWGKKQFPELLQAMGRVPRSDVALIEGVFQRVYGATLEEVDDAFVEYCKKR